MANKRLVLEFPDHDVRLYQMRADSFQVIYGKDEKLGLTYDEAAKQLGACLMHSAACLGVLDNS